MQDTNKGELLMVDMLKTKLLPSFLYLCVCVFVCVCVYICMDHTFVELSQALLELFEGLRCTC